MSDGAAVKDATDPDESLPTRVSQGPVRWLFSVLVLAISIVCLAFVLDVTFILQISFFQEQYFGMLFGLVFAGGFLRMPAAERLTERPVPWYDYVLGATGLLVGLYISIAWPQIVMHSGFLTLDRVVVSLIGVFLVLELTRRAFGWPLVILTAIFALYATFRYMIPGAFGGRAIPWQRLFAFSFTDSESILGMIAVIVFGMVFAFLLFGRALFQAGGGAFFTNLSLSAMGRYRGGPAKVAVVASSLFGTLSGSATSSVVVTGSITIPMMIRSGYQRAAAAAVEAVASSGGALMPPVMGATAFLMAEFIAVPYYQVVIAATLPAILYYLAVFIQVDLQAGRLGLRGLKPGELPQLMAVLRRGWIFMVPLAVLIYCLFIIYLSPAKSAMVALVSVILISYLGPIRFTFRRMVEALINTGNVMIEMGILAAIAGIIVGIINLTGIGLLFSQELLSLAGGSLFILLLLTGAASIILGMSMPVTASYVILAIIAAPAIVQAGVPAMAAHLFILYFATLSFITPPVCVAVFIAATIAKSNPMYTSFVAMKLAVVAFVVPFVFVYDQALMMEGHWLRVMMEFVIACLGFLAIAIAFEGYFLARVGPALRLLLAIAGFAALVPVPEIKLAGVVACLAIIAFLTIAGRRAAARVPPEEVSVVADN